eukprot:CAMPEP_0117017482 /NCGR_PEP_ID=MMETSP0472-20121206/13643_1 /TAXON_ID=693140 ORGANISM="Tiarina fusus, Strain LIS" /NCGR_SAMPLE_ID=MMETSP0472 /ASSEMBLY_ACC=CAM_ASM_000603 /LENGTH=214 /DNA_ID=CAMNT_0004721857 /DNA_START=8 /DNA_END=652 /DNA_ORIENTATION=+
MASAFSGPIGVNVYAAVKPECREEFLKLITADAKGIVAEPGSLQCTLGESDTEPNVFYIHEQYKTMEDFEAHKTTEHCQAFLTYLAEKDPLVAPPVMDVFRCTHEAVSVPPRAAYCLNVELCIKAEVRDEYLKCIYNNQKGSHGEPLCLQYDFGESLETPNSFYFHEQYSGGDQGLEGFVAHTKAPHFAAWEEFAGTDPFSKPPVIGKYKSIEF